MGSSFGGNVALQLALRKPDRFRAVIPVEAAAHAPGFFSTSGVIRTPTRRRSAQRSMGSDGAGESGFGPLATWHYYTQGSEAFRGDLYFYSVDHDLRDSLAKIDARRCPVVMMTGTYDYLTPPENDRENRKRDSRRHFTLRWKTFGISR